MLGKDKIKYSESRCRIIPALILVLAIGFILGGNWGRNKYRDYGFNNELGFDYIYKLSQDVDHFYSKSVKPMIDNMNPGQIQDFVEQCYDMTLSNWNKENGSDTKAILDE